MKASELLVEVLLEKIVIVDELFVGGAVAEGLRQRQQRFKALCSHSNDGVEPARWSGVEGACGSGRARTGINLQSNDGVEVQVTDSCLLDQPCKAQVARNNLGVR
eukprot:5194121-Amphidinium_carterae.1